MGERRSRILHNNTRSTPCGLSWSVAPRWPNGANESLSTAPAQRESRRGSAPFRRWRPRRHAVGAAGLQRREPPFERTRLAPRLDRFARRTTMVLRHAEQPLPAAARRRVPEEPSEPIAPTRRATCARRFFPGARPPHPPRRDLSRPLEVTCSARPRNLAIAVRHHFATRCRSQPAHPKPTPPPQNISRHSRGNPR